MSIRDELDNLETYLRLEKLRLGDKLHWQIDVAADINTDLRSIPPMMIQPFVENAIWHGLLPKEEGQGRLHIQLDRVGQWLCCWIRDNGIGREEAARLRGKFSHPALGLTIIQERIDLLNRYRKTKYRVEVEDLKDGSNEALGTCFRSFFPLKSEKYDSRTDY